MLCPFSMISPNSNPYNLVLIIFVLLDIFNTFFLFVEFYKNYKVLVLVSSMIFMHNLLLRLLTTTMIKWLTIWHKNQICYLALCNAQSDIVKAITEGHNSQPVIGKSFKK